jgi:hypothetical protein
MHHAPLTVTDEQLQPLRSNQMAGALHALTTHQHTTTHQPPCPSHTRTHMVSGIGQVEKPSCHIYTKPQKDPTSSSWGPSGPHSHEVTGWQEQCCPLGPMTRWDILGTQNVQSKETVVFVGADIPTPQFCQLAGFRSCSAQECLACRHSNEVTF